MPITSAEAAANRRATEAAAYAEAQRWCDRVVMPDGYVLMPERVGNPLRHYYGIHFWLFSADDLPPEDYLTGEHHKPWVNGQVRASITIGKENGKKPSIAHVWAKLDYAYGPMARELFELIQDICQQIQELIAEDANE